MNDNKDENLMSIDDLKLLKELITSLDENNEVFKISSLMIEENENVKNHGKRKTKKNLKGDNKI